MERNLRLIPVHAGLTQAYVWMPVFVLFTRARFDLDGALLLSSIYYLSVVVFEVPSGWASDRLGRVPTLRAAAVAWVAAQSCFLAAGDRLAVVAAGQALLAFGFACLSGTDVTFHYDTLEALGRAGEYGRRQATVASIGFLTTAVSALVGGALGLANVRLAFAVALVLAVVQLAVASALREPSAGPLGLALGVAPTVVRRAEDPVGGAARVRPAGRTSWLRELGQLAAYGRDRAVAWLFFYGILLVTLEHVAFVLLQPWLTAVLDRPPESVGATPLLAGVVYAGTSLVGAAAARSSPALVGRLGAVGALGLLAVVSAAVVTVMALTTAVAAVAVALLRSAQTAAAPVIISSEVAPRVARHHRATLLSLDSLAGRLGWGLILAAVSVDAADNVQGTLRLLAVLAWALVAVVALSAAAVRPRLGAGQPAVG